MSIIKLGLEYKANEDWTFRAGYSHGDQPIAKSEVMFNILAPGVMEDHISLGLSKSLGDSGKTLHFALSYALPSSVKGPHPMSPGQEIEIEMNQLEFEVAFSF